MCNHRERNRRSTRLYAGPRMGLIVLASSASLAVVNSGNVPSLLRIAVRSMNMNLPCISQTEPTLSPVTSKPASRGRIKTVSKLCVRG